MTPQQIDLVKATVPVLRENGVALTGYFYNRMLGNNPELKETFNMGHQRTGAQAQALAGAGEAARHPVGRQAQDAAAKAEQTRQAAEAGVAELVAAQKAALA